MTGYAEMNRTHGKNDVPECVPWQSKYREGVLRLFRDVSYKDQLWDWQFESSPFGDRFAPVVLVDAEDHVVGFNGVMPVRISECGREMPALWSCDFYLAEQWRGQGLGSQIKHELHGKASIILAFGVSDRASDVLRHLGWRPDPSVRSYRMIRKLKGWRSWVFRCLQMINRLAVSARRLNDSNAAVTGVDLSVHSFLPEKDHVDELWQQCAAGYERVVQRSHSYLDWRYQKHPLGRYAFVHAERGGKLAGLLVVRIHGEHLRIVDYVGPADDELLKSAMIAYAVRQWRHVTQISAVTSDRQFGRCLAAAGIIPMRGRPGFFRYETNASDKKWFIMAGDSDGEFLQAASDFCDRGASS
jgi:GNAT superfamily N-acetyltransferase